ncbi:hypothetical protein WOLCODRAFT_29702 [Wolfiporia cocos MD-104 SS10]|uniref:Uncharacterized protein n=1 Tax=Wolfiporia cocos (strain MD-104) TaxID=742152 RepID=A0A2H3JFJ0_WOLCO|nr:hypothetical protein WOLCODRAFT_29702 [Wolfiporia cocos MD-104 SS10]
MVRNQSSAQQCIACESAAPSAPSPPPSVSGFNWAAAGLAPPPACNSVSPAKHQNHEQPQYFWLCALISIDASFIGRVHTVSYRIVCTARTHYSAS